MDDDRWKMLYWKYCLFVFKMYTLVLYIDVDIINKKSHFCYLSWKYCQSRPPLHSFLFYILFHSLSFSLSQGSFSLALLPVHGCVGMLTIQSVVWNWVCVMRGLCCVLSCTYKIWFGWNVPKHAGVICLISILAGLGLSLWQIILVKEKHLY